MSIPSKIKSQLLTRLDAVIIDGSKLVNSIQVIPPRKTGNIIDFNTYYRMDVQELARWCTNCLAIFDYLSNCGPGLENQKQVIIDAKQTKGDVQYCLGIMQSLRENVDLGLFDNIVVRVESEITSDYLGQAEKLMGEGTGGQYDHVPAAVLAGAVLEKSLRTLCGQQNPPIPTTQPSGSPKTLNPLIDDLKRAGVFTELRAKQLRVYAEIRNKAAHGEFAGFSKSDVQDMLKGISSFLAEYT